MILNKHKGEFMCRELAALNAVGGTEHAQWIPLIANIDVQFRWAWLRNGFAYDRVTSAVG